MFPYIRIAYDDGHYYIGFDVKRPLKKERGVIEKYRMGGKPVEKTKPLKIGHTAELEFWEKMAIFMWQAAEEKPDDGLLSRL